MLTKTDFAAYFPTIAGEIETAIGRENEVRDIAAALLSGDEEWQTRAAELVALSGQCSDEHLSQLLEAAFSDPDTRVRGMSWIVISDYWEVSQTPERLGQMTRALKERFEAFICPPNYTTPEAYFKRWLGHVRSRVTRLRFALRSRGAQMRLTRALAGEDFPALMNDQHEAGRLLGSHDPNRRIAALKVIRNRRDNAPSILDRVVALAVRDPELTVRTEAIVVTVAQFCGKRTSQILRTLASIVQNRDEHVTVRALAYNGLFIVDRKPPSEIPLVKAQRNMMSGARVVSSMPPSDMPLGETQRNIAAVVANIDWAYVRSFSESA